MTTQHELNKHDTIEHAKLDREMSWDLNTKQKKLWAVEESWEWER